VKLIDVRCDICGKVLNDVFEEEPCDCGGQLKRMFSFRKFSEFKPGMYENFGHEPIFIESREQFKDECEKRNMYQHSGDGCYDIRLTPKRHPTDLIVPIKKKRAKTPTAEEAVNKAYETLRVEE